VACARATPDRVPLERLVEAFKSDIDILQVLKQTNLRRFEFLVVVSSRAPRRGARSVAAPSRPSRHSLKKS
jgi:hypothetical protein